MTHTHAKNKFNTLKNSQPQTSAKEARASFHTPSHLLESNNASLPTLFSSELLDDPEEPFSDRPEVASNVMCRPTKAHASTGMPAQTRTNSLKTIGSFFQKAKEELAGRPIPSSDISQRGGCALTHTVPMHAEKAKGPLPAKVEPDLTPPGRRSMLPCSRKASSQLKYRLTTHFKPGEGSIFMVQCGRHLSRPSRCSLLQLSMSTHPGSP